MKKLRMVLLTAVVICCSLLPLSGCSWEKRFDISLPSLLEEDGWHATLIDEFNRNTLNEEGKEIWTYSPHYNRWKPDEGFDASYACWWCPEMVSVNAETGCLEIKSQSTDQHVCSSGICPAVGNFTGGIETRVVEDDDQSQNHGQKDRYLFNQAFGYFETRVKFPDADGLWSAFWLQSPNQRLIGNDGRDGTEIDVFESAFRYNNKKVHKMGHALLWDGYANSGRVDGHIMELEQDLYDGDFHTFALKWTPNEYVFYIDGKATWASKGNERGVSVTPEYLRLTVEIDAGNEYGPHGQKIGKFTGSKEIPVFYVDYVKVYQNENYKQYIKNINDFTGRFDEQN